MSAEPHTTSELETDLSVVAALFGMPVIVSEMVPETIEGDVAEDFQDRMDAMCAHHIALDLVPLHDEAPGGFMLGNRMVIHPASYRKLTAGQPTEAPE